MDRLKDNAGEEEPNVNFLYQCHKTFISTEISCPILFSFWERAFFPYSRSHLGYSFFSLSLGHPRMSLLQGPEGSQDLGIPPAVGPRVAGRRGSCSPMAPSHGDAQDDSLLLKEVLEGM